MNELLLKTAHVLQEIPKPLIVVLSLVLVIAFGAIDLLVRSEVIFAIFYLLPLALVSWYVGARSGIAISLVSVALLFLDDVVSFRRDFGSFIIYWDAVGRLGSFFIISYALSALRTMLERERALARTDSLTGISNTRAFYELMSRERERAKRYDSPFTLAYMDIDDFKAINDTLGHAAGDQVIKTVAKTIEGAIRAIDIVARVGGDEFVVMFPGADDEESLRIMGRIKDRLDETVEVRGMKVTFSIGMVTYCKVVVTVDEMIHAADTLMYKVKANGKNSILHEIYQVRLPEGQDAACLSSQNQH